MKKQQHKSKEQIIWEKEQEKLAKTRMDFINEKFMPLMDKITSNLEEAQTLTETIKALIDKATRAKIMEMKLWELGIKTEIEKSKYPQKFEKHLKILEILENQSIDDSIRLCDGLYQAVDRAILDQLKNKKISDFKKNEETPKN